MARSLHMATRGIIDVHDASRLVECAQLERQRRFQQLVRHYLSQILHGCKSAYCHTPSCLSSSKRHASRPVRPPTQLTARILAHYLASQDSPQRGLCPHELKVPPDALEVECPETASVQQTSNRVERDFLVYPPIWELQQHQQRARHGKQPPQHASMTAAIRARRQTKKDVKSLAQNLHDTATVIFNYSKQIPTSASTFALLRASDQSSDVNTDKHDEKSKTHPKSIARQHAHQNLRAHSDSHDVHTASELLSNAYQLHKIPYQLPNSAAQTRLPITPDATTLDSTTPPSRLSMRQASKKRLVSREEETSASLHNNPRVSTSIRVESTTQPTPQQTPPLPVLSILNCNVLDEIKEFVHQLPRSASNRGTFGDRDASCRTRSAKPFINRSLFYTLSNPDALLKSFRDSNEAFEDSPLPHLDSCQLVHSFRDWQQQNDALIFDSLWIALEALFTPPPELDTQKSPRLKPTRKAAAKTNFPEDGNEEPRSKAGTSSSRYLTNHEAAHIVLICIHALTSLVSAGRTHIWEELRKLRSKGTTIPNFSTIGAFNYPHLNIIDELEYEPAVRLADRLLRAIGTRTCFEHILASLSGRENQRDDSSDASDDNDATLIDIIFEHLEVAERVALAKKHKVLPSISLNTDPGWTVTATFAEWLRTIILKKWDGKAELNKWSSVGMAFSMLDKFHENWRFLNLRPSMFEMHFFNERLDVAEEPLKYINWSNQPNIAHILQYPSLFPTQHLVAYFRTINFTKMMSQYENTARVHQMQRSLDMFLREPYWWVIKSRMKVVLSDFLVLDISREDPLKDTLDQLWGQEKRMLLKPLKVKMGHQEGEVGLDHGGVTNEFFHIVLSEAFKPDNGMFVIDPQSRMTWFQPRSLEPYWKFEMLGILFSLAIYNGITLPVTFPLALYHFLLPSDSPLRGREIEPDTLDFIKDGWPSLAKAFEFLLTWSDGDVKDVMMREYAFSFDAFGQKIDHNMTINVVDPDIERSIIPSSGDIPMVTNENREQFVKDYIFFLTLRSVAPQIGAFQKGFLTCINPKSLYFFTPSTLRALVEGTQHISVPGLRHCTRYEDGYSKNHPAIVHFWSIVEQYSQEDRRRLLEFVTASDRVPVTGYESITFHIVRLDGDTESLPTSSTCFGKLYLPDYGNQDKMKRKLELALQNSQGFGVV